MALALLARRDFATTELRERLCGRGIAAAVAAAIIAELTAAGALDDERYAANYVAYHAGRGQGPVRIGAELRRHGLTDRAVAAALAGSDWAGLARKVRRARFGVQPPASWSEKARQARFLQYRGFSSDHIRAATGAELEDTGPSEP
ncbi:MAG: regulatory protein RecX [Gammaproteobacteria bacterium]|nr:regulatory protein RecX [Gammaproteobacteria bacterium]